MSPEEKAAAHNRAVQIARVHGLSGAPEPLPGGTLPVFALGEHHVVKLFPPDEAAFWSTEATALAHVHDRIGVPSPALWGQGIQDGWWYVLMGRLQGRDLAKCWDQLDGPTRQRLVTELGHMTRRLHALPTQGLAPLQRDWPAFIAAQRASATERQRKRDLPPAWLQQIDPFLARWCPPDDGRRAVLHTELMRVHVFGDQIGGRWALTGVVDFEPAMVGQPGYEFASVALFIAGGAPGLLQAFGDAYGWAPDPERPMRLMAWCLLHRYSHLPWYLRAMPKVPGATRLEDLAQAWFS